MMLSQHTSAALTINENWDPGEPWLADPLSLYHHLAESGEWVSDVRKGTQNPTFPPLPSALALKWFDADMDMALDKIVPEDLNWLHTDEGPE